MIFSAVRALVAHALPVFVAQIASVGLMLVDTAVLGHVGADDLAAVAIGSGIYVSVVFSLVGILQAVTPVAAHLHGARRHAEAVDTLRHGLLLALLLSIPGSWCLLCPDWLLGLTTMAPAVETKVKAYLAWLAWGVPAALLYRTFYAFCNAVGRPRVLMLIGLANLGLHGVLAWGLGLAGWLGEPLGIIGCAWSNLIVNWLACCAAALYLGYSSVAGDGRQGLRAMPWRWAVWRELLRLGVPMGLSNLVEITAFTLVALFVAPLGAETVAGHRIVANLSALCYMSPLALAIATLSAVGQATGARDWRQAHRFALAGALVAGGTSTLLGLGLWLTADPLVALYTDDPIVRKVAVGLVVYIALYQVVDALQTIAGYVLRAYRVTVLPMLVQTLCFWGVGLGGGWWLCYRGEQPLGVAGFWLASVLSLVLAAALLGLLLRSAIRVRECG